jgi:hypothetical protein
MTSPETKKAKMGNSTRKDELLIPELRDVIFNPEFTLCAEFDDDAYDESLIKGVKPIRIVFPVGRYQRSFSTELNNAVSFDNDHVTFREFLNAAKAFYATRKSFNMISDEYIHKIFLHDGYYHLDFHGDSDDCEVTKKFDEVYIYKDTLNAIVIRDLTKGICSIDDDEMTESAPLFEYDGSPITIVIPTSKDDRKFHGDNQLVFPQRVVTIKDLMDAGKAYFETHDGTFMSTREIYMFGRHEGRFYPVFEDETIHRVLLKVK